VRWCERNNSADTKVSEGGGGGAPGTRAEIPPQPVMKTMVRQAMPLQPMVVHGGANIHLQPVEGTSCQSRWMSKGGCDPVGSPALERVTVVGERSLPVLISTHEPFVIFPVPCPAEEGGVMEWLW